MTRKAGPFSASNSSFPHLDPPDCGATHEAPIPGVKEQDMQQAHRHHHALLTFPFSSFVECFSQRITDPSIAQVRYLTYYDDAGQRRAYTYEEFGAVVLRTMTYMSEYLEIRRGERMAILLSNHDYTVVLYFSAWVLGAVVVPIDINESENRRTYILEHSEAGVVFCWDTEFQAVHEIRDQLPQLRHLVSLGDSSKPLMESLGHPRPAAFNDKTSSQPATLNDEALIVYTSGTTGPPKGVVLTVENLFVDAHGIAEWHQLGTGHCLMCVLPIHHVNGIVVTLLTPWYAKGASVLNQRFHPSVFWSRIQHEGVTCVSVVPTLLEFLLQGASDIRPYCLDRFRGLICGAGPLLKDTVLRFEDQFHHPIRHGYGLSETTCYSSFLPIDLSQEEYRQWLTAFEYLSIGLPIPLQ